MSSLRESDEARRAEERGRISVSWFGGGIAFASSHALRRRNSYAALKRRSSTSVSVQISSFFRKLFHYSCSKNVFWADKCAPVSNSNPRRKAQNIMLAESANGP